MSIIWGFQVVRASLRYDFYPLNHVFTPDIDECTEGNAMCPDENSHCTNTLGSYQCDCDTGFINNGTQCAGKA